MKEDGGEMIAAGGRRGQERRRCIVAVLILVAAAGGCLTVDPWEDARIEAEVKARLVAQKEANLTRLGVTRIPAMEEILRRMWGVVGETPAEVLLLELDPGATPRAAPELIEGRNGRSDCRTCIGISWLRTPQDVQTSWEPLRHEQTQPRPQ
jgi:hypothetical protein